MRLGVCQMKVAEDFDELKASSVWKIFTSHDSETTQNHRSCEKWLNESKDVENQLALMHNSAIFAQRRNLM